MKYTADTRAPRTNHPLIWLALGLLSFPALIALAPSSTSFDQPDEALVAMFWSLACAMAIWWTVSLLLCLLANRSGSRRLHQLCALVAMPVARRVAQGSLALALVAVPACSPSQSSSPQLVMVESGLPTTLLSNHMPSTSLPSTTLPPTTLPPRSETSTTPSTTPEIFHTDLLSQPGTPPTHADTPREQSTTGTTLADRHTVVSGDNLWTIAQDHIAEAGLPSDSVADYWTKLISANKDTLLSGRPSLIFPGEVLTLPSPVQTDETANQALLTS